MKLIKMDDLTNKDHFLASNSLSLDLMNSTRILKSVLIVFSLAFFGHATWATPINRCLQNSENQIHRIEKEQSIENCFQYNKSAILPSKCFNYVDQALKIITSIDLNESLNSICFYEISSFENINSCLQKSDRFKLAENKDEALFECYRQFQDSLSASECKKIAQKMTYPNKKDYLLRHCSNR